MAFALQALFRRVCDYPDKSWATHMPARFQENAETRARVLGRTSVDCGCITSITLPAEAPSSLGDGGGVTNLTGRVLSLSKEAQGCRKVQQALTEARDNEERRALVEELHGHIQKLSRSPHGNHVVQQCIVIMPPRSLQFIITEITGGDKMRTFARHKYACRIVQSLVERCPPEQVYDLVDLLLEEFLELAKHGYGRFVVEKLLRHVVGKQRIRLNQLVEQHVLELALHQNGCAVLCAALEYGDLVDRGRMAELILEASDQVAFMVDTRYGSAILSNLLNLLDGPGCQRLLSLLEANPKLHEALQRGFSDETIDDRWSDYEQNGLGYPHVNTFRA